MTQVRVKPEILYVFLTSTQEMPMKLVLGSHFELRGSRVWVGKSSVKFERSLKTVFFKGTFSF